jgi:transposase InsO family protein
MIGLEQRQHTVLVIDEAITAGCGVAKACKEAGIDRRTFRRWTAAGVAVVVADARPEAIRPTPSNRFSDEERADVLATCHEPRFADVPPSQIVPVLADEGIYQGSESTYYRILHEANEQHERGRARQRTSRPMSTHCATGANQLWSWDVTFLGSPTRGIYYYLYMIMDIWSRKIVGYEVYESETGELAAELFDRTVLAEGCSAQGVVLHSDNGAPQRSSTLRTKLDALGLRTSFSRPRVSNDNAYSEALFRTTKYRHDFPEDGFKTVEDARVWVLGFVRWYNTEHRHSAIKFVTPTQRHEAKDVEILANRQQLYKQAKERNPHRWSGQTRNWERPVQVWLNPEMKTDKPDEKLKEAA